MNSIHDVTNTVNLILRAYGEELIVLPPKGTYRQQIEFILKEYTDKTIAINAVSQYWRAFQSFLV